MFIVPSYLSKNKGSRCELWTDRFGRGQQRKVSDRWGGFATSELLALGPFFLLFSLFHPLRIRGSQTASMSIARDDNRPIKDKIRPGVFFL